VNGSAPGGEVELGVRPEHIAIGGAASAPHEAEVELVEPMGAETVVWCSIAGQSLAVRVDGDARISAGERLPLRFPVERLSLFDAESGVRL
jgi:multiple sugar transport system ATP-binding protein